MSPKAEVRRLPRPLMVEAITSCVETPFGEALRLLKLDVLGTDDSPIPITGYYTPCTHPKVSGSLRLSPESLVPPSTNSFGSRNYCPVPGTLINTNNIRGFQNLDVEYLLREEAKKILHDIMSGKIEEDPSLLLRFLVISFADLKNWKIYYSVAFPSLVFKSEMTLLSLHSASVVLSQEEAKSLSKSLKVWRSSNETTVLPFFWVDMSSDSSIVIRQLKDWKDCQDSGQKLLFGFYDNGYRQDYAGWALRNYIAFLSLRWNMEKVQFLCYRERGSEPDLEKSLIGEASFPPPHGWDDSDYVPEAIGWEGEKPGDGRKEKKLKEINLESMSPERRDEEHQLLHLKLMGWRQFPVNLKKLSSVRCLLLGAGTLGCEVSRLLMTWGVRKLTVVDGGHVSMPDVLKQSLYVNKDCGVPRATAIVPHLKERCPAVDIEAIQMEIPALGNPVSTSVLDDCERLQTLVASSDVVFLLTDTWESRWFPSLLCANKNKMAITAALGYDSYLVMRHGAGPGTRSGSMDDMIAQIQNLSAEDALGRQRLGCCFCSDTTSLVNSVSDETVALPGLTSIVAGKTVELFARMLHHPEGIHAPGDMAGMDTEHQLGLLPHQMRGSLPRCVLSTVISNSSNDCTACSNIVLSEYRREGLNFVMQAINQPTYLKDLTGISNLIKSDTCLKLPASFPVNSGKLSSARCLLLGAGTHTSFLLPLHRKQQRHTEGAATSKQRQLLLLLRHLPFIPLPRLLSLRAGRKMGSLEATRAELGLAVLYLNKAEARDKICRAIQYGSKFISNGQPGTAQNVDKSTTLARKVFRLLKWVNDLHALISPPAKGTPLALVLLGKSKNALLSTFLFLDQFVWLGRSGIYQNKERTDRIARISLYCWMASSVCASLVELGELKRLSKAMRKRAKELRGADKYEDEQYLGKMKQSDDRLLALVKAGMDVVVAVGLLQQAPKKVTPRVTGAFGFVTSLISCYQQLPSRAPPAKLKA